MLLVGWALAGCGGDDEPAAPRAHGPKCQTVRAGESAAVHVTIPAGFTSTDTANAPGELIYQAPADVKLAVAPRVSIAADDPDSHPVRRSDQNLVWRSALAVTNGNDSGTPQSDGAYRRLMRDRLTQVTYNTPLSGDPQLFTVHAQLVKFDGERFTVSLLAPKGAQYGQLAKNVLPTIGTGPC